VRHGGQAGTVAGEGVPQGRARGMTHVAKPRTQIVARV
jgi:hypothetical protein